jgi:nicotinamide-nucleotide amidase
MEITLDDLVKAVAQLLQKQRLKLTTAESCTGGGLAYWLTSLSGSSNWFERGFVTYSNIAKTELLNVSPDMFSQFGAVSEEVALAMAKGALSHSHADIAIATTGIAGPTGGSAQKPVGTVWIAWVANKRLTLPHLAKTSLFTGNRHSIREQSIIQSLQGLLRWLQVT